MKTIAATIQPSARRKRICLRVGKMGRRGAMVRAFIEGELARVFWTENGRQRKESWPNTPAGRAEAKAYAEGVFERLTTKRSADGR